MPRTLASVSLLAWYVPLHSLGSGSASSIAARTSHPDSGWCTRAPTAAHLRTVGSAAVPATDSSFLVRSGACNPPPSGVPNKCSFGVAEWFANHGSATPLYFPSLYHDKPRSPSSPVCDNLPPSCQFNLRRNSRGFPLPQVASNSHAHRSAPLRWAPPAPGPEAPAVRG